VINKLALVSVLMALFGILFVGIANAINPESLKKTCEIINIKRQHATSCEQAQLLTEKLNRYCPQFRIDPVDQPKDIKNGLAVECQKPDKKILGFF
jgi:hypothetical protein